MLQEVADTANGTTLTYALQTIYNKVNNFSGSGNTTSIHKSSIVTQVQMVMKAFGLDNIVITETTVFLRQVKPYGDF